MAEPADQVMAPEAVVELGGAEALAQAELFCFCKQPETQQMIACDICEQWFHAMCFGINLVSEKKMRLLAPNQIRI